MNTLDFMKLDVTALLAQSLRVQFIVDSVAGTAALAPRVASIASASVSGGPTHAQLYLHANSPELSNCCAAIQCLVSVAGAQQAVTAHSLTCSASSCALCTMCPDFTSSRSKRKASNIVAALRCVDVCVF
jgi:hypothetical protein